MPGQPVTASQVARSGALEAVDHVLGVVHDQPPHVCRAGPGEDQLVEELRPHRHHQVTRPDECHPPGGHGVEYGRGVRGGTRVQVVGGAGEEGEGASGDLVVAGAGLQVFLMDVGAGREPVPEQVGQDGALAPAVRRRVAVEFLEAVRARGGVGEGDALVAVDLGEHLHAQGDDRAGQPCGGGQQQRARRQGRRGPGPDHRHAPLTGWEWGSRVRCAGARGLARCAGAAPGVQGLGHVRRPGPVCGSFLGDGKAAQDGAARQAGRTDPPGGGLHTARRRARTSGLITQGLPTQGLRPHGPPPHGPPSCGPASYGLLPYGLSVRARQEAAHRTPPWGLCTGPEGTRRPAAPPGPSRPLMNRVSHIRPHGASPAPAPAR